MDDPFAPSVGHSTTRLVDYTALNGRMVLFTSDVTNALFHFVENASRLRAAAEINL